MYMSLAIRLAINHKNWGQQPAARPEKNRKLWKRLLGRPRTARLQRKLDVGVVIAICRAAIQVMALRLHVPDDCSPSPKCTRRMPVSGTGRDLFPTFRGFDRSVICIVLVIWFTFQRVRQGNHGEVTSPGSVSQYSACCTSTRSFSIQRILLANPDETARGRSHSASSFSPNTKVLYDSNDPALLGVGLYPATWLSRTRSYSPAVYTRLPIPERG